MKRLAVLILLTVAASAAYALPFHGFQPGYFSAEIKALGVELGDRPLSDLKVSELLPLAERLDVARQKDGYVMMAGGLSLMWPGAGQFVVGQVGSGILFTGAHVAVTGASLYWAHSLLPSDLQWGNLDYFGSTNQLVEARWKTHSLNDYLPALGALAAGGAVDFALRVWSASSAHDEAKAAIDDGTVTFEPHFGGGPFGMGLGMRMHW